MIKPLSEAAINQIATSVALQTLSSFVKELVENSIDAGSTLIVITFYESGRQGILVSDNGHGISSNQSHNLAVKGGTSKLDKWEDLNNYNIKKQNVQTHGFRGEALNAISQLAELQITSRYKDEPIGWKLNYANDQLIAESFEREHGTTVKVTNLFRSLPVRRLDFERNYKHQYNITINLLTEYAIIQEDIEFRVLNIEAQNTRQVLVSGKPCNLQQKVRNVLGDKIMQSLQPVEVVVDENNKVFGFVSKTVDSGSIQIKKSLWYTYLNRRPINAPKSLLSLITRIYRQFNPNGHFMFLLNFVVKEADFNVSVDKRDVYFKNEERMSDLLQNEIVNKLESMKEIGKTIMEEKIEEKVIEKEGISKKSLNSHGNNNVKAPTQQKIVKEAPAKRVSGGSSFLSQLQRSMNNRSNTNQNQQDQKQNPLHNITQSLHLEQITEQNLKSELIAQNEELVKKMEQLNYQNLEDSFKQPINLIHHIKQEQVRENIQLQDQIVELQFKIENQMIKEEVSINPQQLEYKIENDQVILPTKIPFKKPYFKDLVILGQFNKGFLVTFWEAGNQIMILDQHACDEKSTFEMLLSKYKITATSLLAPFRIQFVQHQIELLLDKKQQIEQLGMHFTVEDDTVILKTLPNYGKHTFGVETLQNIVELLENTNDNDNETIQLPGLKNVIALQACRTSIMVGQELSEEKMKEMCERMQELQSPWNCPHGRPTFVRLEQSNKLVRIKRGFSKLN